MNDLLIICNRAGLVTRDGWIHIVPKGELPNAEARVTQVLDDVAMAAMLRNIAADRTRLGDRWPGIYAGREHFIYNDAQDSAALAWFTKFELRADGLWAAEEGLTPAGREALLNKTYKFTSFVADRRSTEALPPAADGTPRLRITRLDTVGFTNQANGKELLVPITNRAGADAPAQPTQPTKQNMKSIAPLLGLSPDASEESVHASVSALKNRAETAEGALAPLKLEVTTLTNRVAAQAAETADADLAPLQGRLAPEALAPLRASLLANRAATLPLLNAFLALHTAPAAPPPSAATGPTVLANRAGQPAAPAAPAGHDTPEAFAAVIKNRAAGVSRSDALRAATASHPLAYAAWRALGSTAPALV